MPTWSNESTVRLLQCHPDLVTLFNIVIQGYDCKVLCGHRSHQLQLAEYRAGRSQVLDSRHNMTPSGAIDVAPYPVYWPDAKGLARKAIVGRLVRFYHFAGYVLATAEHLGIKIRWGGDWDSDNDFMDQKFHDLIHFERV